MSERPTPSLRDLAADYFVRDLNAEEHRLLEAGLASDPELRQHLAELARDEWLLHHVHQAGADKVVPLKPQRSWARSVVAMAACFIALLAVGGLLILKMSRENVVTRHDPEIQAGAVVTDIFTLPGSSVVVENNGQRRTLKLGDRLAVGDRIVTPAASRFAFRYQGEESTVRLGGGTIALLKERDGARHIQLAAGKLSAQVAAQPADRPMRITTADAEATVLGTAFELLAGESTRLSVLTGRVEFRSLNHANRVLVEGGFMADASRAKDWRAEPFQIARHTPALDATVNNKGDKGYIVVDPVRRYMGFLKFNLGTIGGEVQEARLRLRVMQKKRDDGGDGNVRLFRTGANADWSSGAPTPRVELAQYRGKLGPGMDLEFTIPPQQISDGVLVLLVTMDPKGNDFWFSSSEGPTPPELTLKIVPDGTPTPRPVKN